MRSLLLSISFFLVAAVARADNYTIYLTTVTGNGQTNLIPNLGGPLTGDGTYIPSSNEFKATYFQVITPNPNATIYAEADFFLGSGSTYHDLDLSYGIFNKNGVFVPSVTTQFYGPSLAVNTGGNNVSADLGTFNLTDSSGDPFTYTVTSMVGPPIPSAPEIDPSLATAGLALLAGSLAILRGRRLRQAS